MLRSFAFVACALLAVACVDSNGSEVGGDDGGGLTVDAKGPPINTADGAVDSAAPPPPVDGSTPRLESFSTGIGAGATVAHSKSFTLITRTGGTPGGAGVKKSQGFTIVGGVTPAGTGK